jgi:hypothetical protein
MNIQELLASTLKKLEHVEKIMYCVGTNLTEEQRTAVSTRVHQSPDKLIGWINTTDGKAALREFADKFITGVQ